MSANPLELFWAYDGLDKPTEAKKPHPHERRKCARTRLHWPVLLFLSDAADAIQTFTRDLSSGGFYCMSTVPVTPGETLICTLRVPTYDPDGKHLERSLECKVRIMRVEPQDDSAVFGVACRIEDYRFAHT
jgi:hypothetical protein